MDKLYVIDYTIFNGDPIIELRIPYLYDYVDEFIIVESLETFSGLKKNKYYFDDYREILKPYMDKITFLGFTSFPTLNNTKISYCSEDKNAWSKEYYQRNYATEYIIKKYKNKKYYLIVCDVDEIPRREILKTLPKLYNYNNNDYYHLEMNIYKYSFRWMKKEKWYHPYIVPDKLIKLDSLDKYRMKKKKHINNAGWHCCYFNTINNLIRKLESFSHTEFNKSDFKNREFIKNCMLAGRFFLNLSGNDILYINTSSDLPEGWVEFQKNLDRKIWEEENNFK